MDTTSAVTMNLPHYGNSEVLRVVEVFTPRSGWDLPQRNVPGEISYNLNAARLAGATHVQLEIRHARIGIPQVVRADFSMSEIGIG